ncbi:enoyl-CoA hydratase/isomerase family protein [Spirillospora sp. CA-255316]
MGESELAVVLRGLAAADEVRVVVLLAQGRAFSAGGDFGLMLEINVNRVEQQATLRRARPARRDPAPPAAAGGGSAGAAIGLGATVPLGSDAVVASRNATIADTHVGVGLVAGDGGALFRPQSAGMLRARRYLLTGEPLDASRAYEFGLVTDLVDEPEDVAPTARGIAARIAALPPLAVQGTKAALTPRTSLFARDAGTRPAAARANLLACLFHKRLAAWLLDVHDRGARPRPWGGSRVLGHAETDHEQCDDMVGADWPVVIAEPRPRTRRSCSREDREAGRDLVDPGAQRHAADHPAQGAGRGGDEGGARAHSRGRRGRRARDRPDRAGRDDRGQGGSGDAPDLGDRRQGNFRR